VTTNSQRFNYAANKLPSCLLTLKAVVGRPTLLINSGADDEILNLLKVVTIFIEAE
jgi:hypothetical protein